MTVETAFSFSIITEPLANKHNRPIEHNMDLASAFSYACNACGRCCHDQVIALSPYDVIAIAREAGISTGEAIRRHTIRRGSILKFADDGGCAALDGVRCGIHRGRPLACRLYPLGLERGRDGAEIFIRLEPATGSAGIYGESGTVAHFLEEQDIAAHLEMNARYAALLPLLRGRIAATADFELTEPREFWRVACREAFAETNYDPNPLIDEIFDADAIGCACDSVIGSVEAHLAELTARIRRETNPAILAAVAVMLAVSLGYSPGEIVAMR
jgi:Fe-S-cluster containining protein